MCYQCGKLGHIAGDCKVKMVVIKGNSASDDSMGGEANERVGVIEENVRDPKANFTITAETIEICDYALTSIIYDDVQSSYSLELEDQAQDQIKEEESMADEVDQLRIGLIPQKVPNSQGLEDRVPDYFKEKRSKKGEDDKSGTESNPQEMVDETLRKLFLATFQRLMEIQN